MRACRSSTCERLLLRRYHSLRCTSPNFSSSHLNSAYFSSCVGSVCAPNPPFLNSCSSKKGSTIAISGTIKDPNVSVIIVAAPKNLMSNMHDGIHMYPKGFRRREKKSFDLHIEENFKKCDPRDIANLLRLSGKKSRVNTHLILRKHLPAIAIRVEELACVPWLYMEIAFVIYGLQCFDEETLGYLSILASMAKVIRCALNGSDTLTSQSLSMLLFGLQKNVCNESQSLQLLAGVTEMIAQCDEKPCAQAVGNALYGMQGMSSERSEVRQLLSALIPYISSCEDTLKPQHIGNALYGMQRMDSSIREVRDMILALLPKINSCQIPLRPQHVGNALYGMQSMRSDSDEACAMLSTLLPKIKSCQENLTSQEIGMALYGMQGMKSNRYAVCAILMALVPKIENCTALDQQAVGNILYSMKNMSCVHHEVCVFLSALIPHIILCSNKFTEQNIDNAFYGLQGMSSSSPQVRTLLSALIPKIDQCTEAFKARTVSNILVGMQGMTSEHSEVRTLLSILEIKLFGCEEKFNSQNISNSLYGLQGMNCDNPEVRTLLLHLSSKVKKCTDTFNAQSVGNAVYGLQNMNYDCIELRTLLSVLISKIENCDELLNFQQIGNGLYGLIGIKCDKSIPRICHYLLSKIDQNQFSSNRLEFLRYDEILCLFQSLALSQEMLEKYLNKTDYQNYELIIQQLNDEMIIRNNLSSYVRSRHGGCNIEKRLEMIIRKMITNSDIELAVGKYLLNLFEGDLILKIPQKSDNIKNYSIVNIEIDGMNHLHPTKKRFCSLRDNYLKSKNILVVRIEAHTLRNLSDRKIKDWILGILSYSSEDIRIKKEKILDNKLESQTL